MKCEAALAAFSTGNSFRRRQAIRHARRCPDCSLAFALNDRMSSKLSVVPSLEDDQRATWMRATEVPIAVPTARTYRSRRLIVAAIFASAAVLLAAVISRQPARPSSPRAVSPPVTAEASIARSTLELEAMGTRLESIEQELVELRRRAELLDASEAVDELWARYAPRDGLRTL